MVDTLALGASAERRGGSSPLSRTKENGPGIAWPFSLACVRGLVLHANDAAVHGVDIRGASRRACARAEFSN